MTASSSPQTSAAAQPTPSPQAPGLDAAQRESHAARRGLLALLIGFGLFMAWAAWAPLDEGVPSPGSVAIDTKRKTVQHLTGGLIREVLVKEGEVVAQGQPLMRLDEAMPRANFEAARQRYLGLRVMEDRLRAEQAGAASIAWHPDVRKEQTQPSVQQAMLTQQQLLATRRAALAADLQALNEAIAGQQAMIATYQTMQTTRQTQARLLADELAHTRSLVAEGYAPRNRQLELERSAADVATAQADLAGNLSRAQRSVAELKARQSARQQEYRKEVDTQIADVSREVGADAEKYRAASDDLARTVLRSPAQGQVVGLTVQTVGAVIGPGQKLMDIVPEGHPLLVEAHVAPHLIDRVRKDLAVDVRFSSFAHSPQLVVQGQVISVSADLVADAPNIPPYYLARVRLTPEGVKTLGARQLQAGMPVEVVFKTGERSMLTYLLKPLTKRMAASMKEE